MSRLLPKISLLLLLCGSLLVACQAPTVPPVVVETPPGEDVTPSPPVTQVVQATPSATPGQVRSLPAQSPAPSPDLPGRSVPVHYLPAPVCCLAADPFDLRVVYALLANEQLYLSPDRGQTWKHLPMPHEGQPSLEVPTASVGLSKIHLSPNHPGLIFVLSRGSLLRSPDRGQTWEVVAREVGAWTVNEQFDLLHLYAWRTSLAAEGQGLFRSTDQGETWELMYPGSFPPAELAGDATQSREGILSLAADPSGEESIYAGTNRGIFRSRTGGRTWELLDTGLPPAPDGLRRAPQLLVGEFREIYALTEGQASGANSELLLVRLVHGQVIPDQDSWQVVAQGELGGHITRQDLGFYGVYGLEIDPLDEQALYLATASGLLASRDGGQHFERMGAAQARRPVYRVEAAPGVPTRLYLSTAEGFADLPVEWSALTQASPPVPWPPFTPQVEFTVIDYHGGELTAFAVDQSGGPNPGMAYVAIGPRLVLMDVLQETVPDVWSSIDLEGELAKSIAVSAGRVYVLSGERTLREIDVTDRANPRLVSKTFLPNPARFLTVHGEILIVSEEICSPAGCQGGLRLFTLASGLRELVFVPGQAPIERIEFLGEYAYAFEQSCRRWACTAGLRVVDLAAEPIPRLTATLDLPGRVAEAAVEGDRLYLAHRSGLMVLDVSNPARPREANPLNLDSLSSQEVNGMAISQGYAYLLSQRFAIDIYSLENPDKPRFVKTWEPESFYTLYDILSLEQVLYVLETFGEFGYCDSNLYVLELSDPLEPRLVATGQESAEFVCASPPTLVSDRLYLSDWDGLHILDLADPEEPRLWAAYTVSGPVIGLVADQLRLFWSNYRSSDSLYGMDISDPEHPSISGPLPSSWTLGMSLNWNLLYTAAWADGLQVLDVFEVGSPVRLSSVDADELGQPLRRQVVLDGRYLYLLLDEGGLRVLDVADPSRPRIIGRFDLFGFSFSDLAIQGDYAYLLTHSWEAETPQGEIQILDIQNPDNPRQVGRLSGLEGEGSEVIATSRGWLYVGGQACPPAAPKYSSCAGRLVSYRLANPQRPERAGELDLPEGVTDIVLEGDRGFLAAGTAGVWALDLRDPARPAITGQQDIPSGAQALAVVFNRVYVAAGPGGLVVLDVAEK